MPERPTTGSLGYLRGLVIYIYQCLRRNQQETHTRSDTMLFLAVNRWPRLNPIRKEGQANWAN